MTYCKRSLQAKSSGAPLGSVRLPYTIRDMAPLVIGERIFRARKAHGFSQEAVGKRLGISHAAISNWEKEKDTPSLENLIQFAALVSLPTSYFLGEMSEAACTLSTEWQALPLRVRAITWNCLNEATHGALERRRQNLPTETERRTHAF